MPRTIVEMDALEDLPEQLISYFDPATPTSLHNLLPWPMVNKLRIAVGKLPDRWDLLGQEELLLVHLREDHGFFPAPNDYRVRLTFWLEYENAIMLNRRMIKGNIHSLVCNERLFDKLYLTHPPRVFFLLCKPAEYQAEVKDILGHGLKHYRRILDMEEYEMVKGQKKLNMKLLDLKVKITAMMDYRVNGAPTQKIHQMNLNVNQQIGSATPGQKTIDELVREGDMVAIQDRLKEINRQIRHEQAPSEAVVIGEPVPIKRQEPA